MLLRSSFFKLIFISNLLIALSSCGTKVDAKKLAEQISTDDTDSSILVYDNNNVLLGKMVDLNITGDRILIWNSKTQALFQFSISGDDLTSFARYCYYESSNCTGSCLVPSNFAAPGQITEGPSNTLYKVINELPSSKSINSLFSTTCQTLGGPVITTIRNTTTYSLPTEISYPIEYPISFKD